MNILLGSIWLLIGCFSVDSTEDECVAEFDCSKKIDAAAFGNGKKCYYPATSATRNQTVTFCNKFEIKGYNQWSIANPRNDEEYELLAAKINNSYWWVGQHDRDLEQAYKNHDDPADCPGVFLDWQVDDGEPSADPAQKCIVFTSKENNKDAFSNTNCESKHGVICKAISPDFAEEVSVVARSACGNPLGMQSRDIKDSQISESSFLSNDFKGRNARLDNDKNWTPTNRDPNKYIQVDLNHTKIIGGIEVQGSAWSDAHVEKLKVYYKTSASDSFASLLENDSKKEFKASTDENTVVPIMFTSPIAAQVIKIVPTKCHRFCSLRMELLGCTSVSQSKCANIHPKAIQKTTTSHECYITRDAIELNTEDLNFQEAVDYCKGLNLGRYSWEVPDILNDEESEFLRNTKDNGGAELPFNDHNKNFWAGQNARAADNQWTYLNQAVDCPAVFLKWKSDDPDDEYRDNAKDCVLIAHGGGFVHTSCDEYHEGICEMTIPEVAFHIPLEVTLDVLPFNDPNGNLSFLCTVRVSDVANYSSTVSWNNTLTSTTTAFPDGVVSVSPANSSCSQSMSIGIPSWLNSEFKLGQVQCEAGGQTASVLIEHATVKSLNAWFDVKAKELRLACTVTNGHPKPKVQWTFGTDSHITASSGRYTINNTANTSTLIVSNYNPGTDDGYYTCSAVVATRILDFEVINAVLPRITLLNRQTSSTSYSVTCNAMGSPSSFLSWNDIIAPTSGESFFHSRVNTSGLQNTSLQAAINVMYTDMDDRIEVCCILKDSLTKTAYDQQCIDLGCECRANYTFHGGSCYRYSHELQNWQNANSTCVAEESHLVHIELGTEQKYFESLRQHESGFWIGLRKQNPSATETRWEPGFTKPIYSNFFHDPAEVHNFTCYQFDNIMEKWKITWCGTKLRYICEQEIVQLTSTLQTGTPMPGQNATLICQVKGTCADLIIWQHQSVLTNGHITVRNISATSTNQVGDTQHAENGTLVINNYADETDDGIYNCLVVFNNQLITSPDTPVIGAGILQTLTAYDARSNTYKLACTAKGTPAPNISWIKDNKPLTTDGVKIRLESTVSIGSLSDTAKYEILTSILEIQEFVFDGQETTYECKIDVNGQNVDTQAIVAFQYPPSIVPCDFKFSNHCYTAVNERVSFEIAEKRCQKNYGGHLVTIGSTEEMIFIADLVNRTLRDFNGLHLWQGFRHNSTVDGNKWYTVDGSSMPTTDFWKTGEPSTSENFDCGALVVNTTLHTARLCKELYGYICVYEDRGAFGTVTTTQMTTILPTTTETTILPTTTETTTVPTTTETTTLPTTTETTILPTTTETTTLPTTTETTTLPTTTETTTLPTTTETTTLPTTTETTPLPTTTKITTLPTTTMTTTVPTTTETTTLPTTTKATTTRIATTTKADTTTMNPTTTPLLTTNPPPTTTTVPITMKAATTNPCLAVDEVVGMKEMIDGNICGTYVDFLAAAINSVEQEIGDGQFHADKIDEVFDYLKQAPILEDDIEQVVMASQEAVRLCSKLLEVIVEQNEVNELKEMGSQQKTLVKTTNLLHEYSHKLPKDNCLSAKRQGDSTLSSDFCNINTPKALKYYEFREESSYSSDENEDKFSLEWSKVPDILENDGTYFVATHVRLEPLILTTTSSTDKTMNGDGNDVQLVLNSETITFSLWSNNTKLSVPCYITLQHKESVDTELPSEDDDVPAGTMIRESICVYWDVDAGNWSTYGCEKMTSESSAQHTSCYCNHTTSFAVLMQIRPYETSKPDEIALTWITFIGCSISLALMLFTTYIYWYLRMFLWSDRIFVHQNLILAIILAQCLFLGGINQTENENTCKFIAIFLHLFCLAVFSWMLVDAFHLYCKIVRVFGTENSNLFSYIVMGWGVPMMITAISFGAGYDGYGSQRSCWLDTNSGLIWAFVAPAVFVILVNLIILGLIIRIIVKASRLEADVADQYYHIKNGIKTATVLLPIMGFTWLFGILAVNSDTTVFAYLFTFFNSFQGAAVFLVYCYFNKEVRAAWKKKRQRDESIKMATTTIPEGATVTEHGIVVFKFAGGPETNRSSPIPPSTSLTSKRNSKLNDDIIIEDMTNESYEMNRPIRNKKMKKETKRAQPNAPKLGDKKKTEAKEPSKEVNTSKRPRSNGSRPESMAVQMTPDLESVDDNLKRPGSKGSRPKTSGTGQMNPDLDCIDDPEDIQDEIMQVDSPGEKRFHSVVGKNPKGDTIEDGKLEDKSSDRKSTSELEAEPDYDEFEPPHDTTNVEQDDDDLGRPESSMRTSPLDADDVSVHSKSRMSSARSQKDYPTSFELPGAID